MMRPEELYACLYAPEFPVQALLRLRPELQGKPCVVMEGNPPMEQVCSLNAKAKLLAMECGMTRVEVDTFPSAVVLPRSQSAEEATKLILLECAADFSPRVEERSGGTAFICGIDIAGTSSLFGPPEKLARALLQRVEAIGVKARIAVSPNFHAAVCLAKGSQASIQIVASGQEAAALSSLPLSVLNLTEMQAETFVLWGIHSLGALAALPEKELISRMGQEAKRLRQMARGELPHLLQPIEPRFALEEQIELDGPVEILDSLLFVIGVMLDQLIVRAKAGILALAAITVTLTLDGGSTHTRTVRPALPTNDKQLWIKLLHLDLQAHPAQAAVLKIAIHAEPGDTSKLQLGLFFPQVPEASRLDVTMARIRAIVGEDNAGRAVLLDAHAPESFHIEPFTVSTRDSSLRASGAARAAMRRLRPAEITSVTLHESRPAGFCFRERQYRVERAYGPWMTDGDWWNQTLWGQEQWDLIARGEDESILCCCLSRDLFENVWQVTALYD